MKGFVIVIATSIACSAATVTAYDLFFAQKIVAVDLVSSIASQKEDYAAGRVTAAQLVENIEIFLRRMEKKKRNEVLILEEAVAGDVEHRRLHVEEDDHEGQIQAGDRHVVWTYLPPLCP
ncbi:MAG: hypothetical protein A4E61_01789 [Syntrophorhabdus sp. PtaB.Bin184]|jgi:hypothetical protein|nr:MAG: hypothetical protein A4E61_01789 [Syntrophorhabdus sp. PtaB.Bin184]